MRPRPDGVAPPVPVVPAPGALADDELLSTAPRRAGAEGTSGRRQRCRRAHAVAEPMEQLSSRSLKAASGDARRRHDAASPGRQAGHGARPRPPQPRVSAIGTFFSSISPVTGASRSSTATYEVSRETRPVRHAEADDLLLHAVRRGRAPGASRAACGAGSRPPRGRGSACRAASVARSVPSGRPAVSSRTGTATSPPRALRRGGRRRRRPRPRGSRRRRRGPPSKTGGTRVRRLPHRRAAPVDADVAEGGRERAVELAHHLRLDPLAGGDHLGRAAAGPRHALARGGGSRRRRCRR